MLPFDHHGGSIRVWGLATTSQESFPSQRLLMTYVNGRAVRDRMLLRAITQSYQSLLPRGRYPAVALFVEVQPEEVDVNVHPMKTEVRFRHSGAVFEQVYHALRKRLADQADGVAFGEANNSLVDGPAADRGNLQSRAAAGWHGEPQASRSEAPLRLVPDHAGVLLSQRPLPIGFNGTGSSAPAPALDNPATPRIPNYSSLRIVGQLFAGYIALEGDDGLLLIDQHAAHERVTFEKLRAEMAAGGIRVQSMLTPAPVELNQSRASLVAASLPELRAMGFEAEMFGPATILLKGAPAIFGTGDAIRLFSDMIDSMGEHGLGPRGEAAFEDCLKTLACHGSVRAGRALEPREITELLAALDATQFKTNCPHGRPVHIEFRRGSIERMFRR
jgi:DNA mismatch repair protein MutL